MLIITPWGSGTFFFYWWVNRGSDPTDCSLPVSSVHGILQARILEWMFPSPGDLPNPGIKPRSPTVQAVSLQSEPPGKPFKQRFRDVKSSAQIHGWKMAVRIWIHICLSRVWCFYYTSCIGFLGLLKQGTTNCMP